MPILALSRPLFLAQSPRLSSIIRPMLNIGGDSEDISLALACMLSRTRSPSPAVNLSNGPFALLSHDSLVGTEHIILGDGPYSEMWPVGLDDVGFPTVSMSYNLTVTTKNRPSTVERAATYTTTIYRNHRYPPILIPDLFAIIPPAISCPLLLTSETSGTKTSRAWRGSLCLWPSAVVLLPLTVLHDSLIPRPTRE